ncbi:unnamed protein product [Pocillopora meandrina]|uniref:Uncharacterized protein n=1 Tax=Pocillopora meandrina TaxID=46732 RepID=A0AAU9WUN2_9CNID|nr:unnamed protein product [Pocillopora meandrina]
MAANVVGRVSPTCCRLFLVPVSRKIAKPPSFVARRFSSSLKANLRPVCVPQQHYFRRFGATFTGHGEHGSPVADEELQKWLEEAKNKSWLWRYFHDVDEIERSLMSEQEYNDREKMVEKVVLLCFDNLLCQCQGKKLSFIDL